MNRVQKRIIKDALDQEHELTEWEAKFINDMANKDDDYRPTAKQNEQINRIGTKLA